MEYYTQLEKLIIPEYGRNIQMMIEYIVNLPDREKRNRMAHALVNIMAQLTSREMAVKWRCKTKTLGSLCNYVRF